MAVGHICRNTPHCIQIAATSGSSTAPIQVGGPRSCCCPAFGVTATYFQGAPITTTWRTDANDLVISFSGTVSTLSASGEVRLAPPGPDSASAAVSVTATGTLSVDRGRVSIQALDAIVNAGVARPMGCRLGVRREPGLSDPGPAVGSLSRRNQVGGFGLEGGTSSWKTNSPTVTIALDKERQVSGWVTRSNNPNDDNLGVWPASDEVLPSWKYTIVATRP